MKHKILISAFSCLPNRGSEPGIGWNWAIEAAKTQEVYVLTRTKCKDKIETELLLNPVSNLHFIYCDSNSKLRKISIYMEYIHWQWVAYLFLKNVLRTDSFDYLIHLTFGNMFLPFWTYKLNIPYIWGPLGGGERVPSFMYDRFNLKDQIPHFIKKILIKSIQVNPFVLGPANKADLIIARTNDTKEVFPEKFHNKIEIKLETCIDSSEVEVFNNKPNSILKKSNVNLVYTGRLIPLKNVELLIDAFKSIVVNNPLVKLHIIGDGNQREYLQSKVNSCNMQNNVIFYGMIPREEALKIVGESDIYVFPSLKEGGAWSLMEAMALGKPAICLKLSGMEIITDDSSAIRVEGNNYSDLLESFTSAITSLINNPVLRRNMGGNAKQRMLDVFSWDCIGRYIEVKLNELDEIKKN